MKKEPLVLLLVLFLRVLLGLLAATVLSIGLVPDEAQYWLWSRDLSLGYYSKPLGIAYEIAAGTILFGSDQLGVRFFAIIIAGLIGWSLYYAARSGGFKRQIALYAALVFCLSPVGLLGSFAATTDGGMLLFSILAFSVLLKALNRSKAPSWPLFGLFVMVGALFKWTAFLLFLPAFLGLILYPVWRTKSFWVGAFIALVGFVPALIWNYERGFPTFAHVYNQIVPEQRAPNPLSFLLVQILLLFPIPFFYFIKALIRKSRKPDSLSFSAYAGALLLLLYCFFSLFQKMQSNWALIFMPFAALAAAALGKPKMLRLSMILSSVLSLALLFTPFLEKREQTAIPYRYNLFKEAMGWDSLQELLKAMPPHDFLFASNYQMASILSFYSPEQTRAYLLNFEKRRLSHFAFLPSLKEEQLGKNGLLVYLADKPFSEERLVSKLRSQLSDYFSEVIFIGNYPLFVSQGKVVKWALVFQGISYNGHEPDPSNLPR